MEQYVAVPVPVSRVREVIEHIYATAPSAESSNGAEHSSLYDLVERVYNESRSRHRRLWEYLAEHAPEKRNYQQITDDLGYDSRRSLPGVLGAYGRRANHRYGGFRPYKWEWLEDVEEWALYMDVDIADIIKDVARDTM